MMTIRPIPVVGLACVVLLLFAAAPIARALDSRVADAAMHQDAAAVRALLRQGADVNGAQGDGMTALHWAAERGDQELTALLLSAGANPGAGRALASTSRSTSPPKAATIESFAFSSARRPTSAR